jgi:hypothetical protein
MGDTFERVTLTSENSTYKELAKIMFDNEFLINRHKQFKNNKYIIVINEEKSEETIQGWEGRLNHIKAEMEKKVKKQNDLLGSL